MAAVVIERFGVSVDLASMREFDAPSYDGDGVKRAWVEFLGERPDRAVDRVDS